MSTDREFITGLPKAELHLHLEGTLEPELKLELARRNGVDIGQTQIDEIRASYTFTDLTSFLAVYYPAMQVLVTEQDFHDLAIGYLRRAAADGVVHAEMFFDPQAHTDRGVAFSTVIDGLWSAVQEAPDLGVDASLIMCFLRDLSAESAMETLEASLPYRDRIVGVGLDSDERDNPPEKFAEVFARAREAGYRLTMHCDIDQADSIGHIGTVVHQIGVSRIDHGTNIVEDPQLVDEVRRRGIGLTCCPISNSFVTLNSTPTSSEPMMKGREIVDLLRDGVKVSLASDDPAYFGGYLVDNFLALSEEMDLSRDDLVQLARNSLEISWLDESRKAELLGRRDEYAAR
ncbi:MAG: adenosine deaminase [Acidipropionibacterium jensenii]|uniref:adenosine deaminase n=1 Tax=Acidipropionibacterium jensenii TaxID=1749 RepID=UPI0026487DD3|nr:adenosine deaminase [Acidipropionibacterium jensenii]MDN6513957.1 adenosine deaminase [Acidipropionibacterium jensenii]